MARLHCPLSVNVWPEDANIVNIFLDLVIFVPVMHPIPTPKKVSPDDKRRGVCHNQDCSTVIYVRKDDFNTKVLLRREGDSMASLVPINGSSPTQIRGAYMAVSPEGLRVEIPKELFVVLCDFLQIRKDAGSMVVHFRNGGVAGLEALIKKRYK